MFVIVRMGIIIITMYEYILRELWVTFMGCLSQSLQGLKLKRVRLKVYFELKMRKKEGREKEILYAIRILPICQMDCNYSVNLHNIVIH